MPSRDFWQGVLLAPHNFQEDEWQENNQKWVTEYHLAVNSEDVKGDIERYNAGEMALADAKAFVHSFNLITQTQKNFRRRGETSWASPRWINGK